MSADIWWKQPITAATAKKAKYLAHCAKCGADNPPQRCSKCSAVAYCGRACQAEHWREHKVECPTLALKLAAALQVELAADSEVHSNGGGSLPTSSSTSTYSTNLPLAATEIYSYDDFQRHWASFNLVPRIPCGLLNLRNTCYANALIQILMATRPLAAHLLEVDHASNCPKPPNQWCPMCCLSSWAKKSLAGSQPAIALNPRELITNLKKLNPRLTLGDQHDAQELYTSLLEALELVSLREAEKAACISGATLDLDRFSKETTPINHVFTCYTRNQVDCLMCGNISSTTSSDSGIMLNVPKRAATIEELLKEWSAVERLEGSSAYQCDACRAKVKAERFTMLEVAPNILSIHLSRVDFRLLGENKTSAPVSFPKELDMRPFMAADAIDNGEANYKLYGVVAHEGVTPDDGHYTAFVRYGEQWYVGDDDVVEKVTTAQVLGQQREAYLLFYERTTPKMLPLVQDINISGAMADSDISKETTEALAALLEIGTPSEELMGMSTSDDLSSKYVADSVRGDISAVPAVEEGAEGPPLDQRANGVAAAEVQGDKAGQRDHLAGPEVDSGGDSSSSQMDQGTEIGGSEDSIYECRQVVGPSGLRELRLSVHLPRVLGEIEPEFKIEASESGIVWTQVNFGEGQLLRMPLPLRVALPAKSAEWSSPNKEFIAVFDVS